MLFRFETTDTAAMIKTDQYVGNFKDAAFNLVPTELSGLNLTLNYWSSFSSYTITCQIPIETIPATGGGEYTVNETVTTIITEWTDAPSAPLESNVSTILSKSLQA
ncbi:MAG: hypothetical protein ACFFCT_10090 [Candidatus Odinarchaeota archaeon]